jgi:hypothetical protein
MVRYLAVLRRAFSAIESHGLDRGPTWRRWTGHLADALHNVPATLSNYSERNFYRPKDLHYWLGRGFLESLRHGGAPAAVVEATEIVLKAGNDSEELGLPSGSHELRLPDPETLERFFSSFYGLCLSLRRLRSVRGSSPSEAGDSEGAEVHLDSFGAFAKEAAGALATLPCAIVNWPAFDAAAYESTVRERLVTVPEERRESWLTLVLARPRPSR